MHCRPVKLTATWPTREELHRLLSVQLDRMVEAVAAGESRLDDTLAGRIIHGLHDEARHQGEMYLLLKLYRVGEK
jgi:hypothetical protein